MRCLFSRNGWGVGTEHLLIPDPRHDDAPATSAISAAEPAVELSYPYDLVHAGCTAAAFPRRTGSTRDDRRRVRGAAHEPLRDLPPALLAGTGIRCPAPGTGWPWREAHRRRASVGRAR